MSEHSAHHPVEMGSERNFGLLFAAIFTLAGLLPVLTGHGPIRWWALLLAASFLVVALVASHQLAPLNRMWFRFGLVLGKIVSPLAMGFFFFAVITPFASLLRAMGQDILKIGAAAKQRDSYWTTRPEDPEHPSSMRNQF